MLRAMTKKHWLLLLCIGLCASCSESPTRGDTGTQAAANSWLSETQAQQRKASVSNLRYELDIRLEQTEATFAGEATLLFDYNGSGPIPMSWDNTNYYWHVTYSTTTSFCP